MTSENEKPYRDSEHPWGQELVADTLVELSLIHI